MLWGRITYEMMESSWPAVARGAEEAPPAMREWAIKLEAKPKYVVSSTRKDFPWTNSHHIGGDLRTEVQRLKDAMPGGVLLGSGKLATELDRLELIDEYRFLVHPRLAGHGPSFAPAKQGGPAWARRNVARARRSQDARRALAASLPTAACREFLRRNPSQSAKRPGGSQTMARRTPRRRLMRKEGSASRQR